MRCTTARAHGWKAAAQEQYVDDAISRAEFKKRPGLISLLNGATNGDFDVVITRNETRLGGDMVRTTLVIQDLLEAGVQLYYYFNGEEVRLDDATAGFMVAARNFSSELEREKISQRTHEHLLNKARRGLNVGDRCYGYDNIEIKNGDQRSHVEYAINEKQAEVLRLIFQLYSDGQGLRAIVKLLNERGISSPSAGKMGTGSWSTSAIRTMLRRTRYAGVIEWNRREKTYRGGTKVRLERNDSEILRIEAPHLRIIDEKLWSAVQNIINQAKHSEHKNVGRPAVYLLSGIARCSECDGPLTVINHKSGKNTLKVYACAYHRSRGNSVCTNTTRRPVDSVNESLVSWFHANVLTEQLVTDIVYRVRIRLDERAKVSSGTAPELEREASRLRTEVTRLAEAIKTLAEREERLAQVDTQLRAQKAAPDAIRLELKRLEVEARKRITDLQGALSRNPSQARQVVQALLADGRLTATPIQAEDSPRFQLEGEAIVGPLLTGEGPLGASAPATRLVPEGTAQDGGEKQARRHVTKVASPTGFERDGTCRKMPSNVAVCTVGGACPYQKLDRARIMRLEARIDDVARRPLAARRPVQFRGSALLLALDNPPQAPGDSVSHGSIPGIDPRHASGAVR